MRPPGSAMAFGSARRTTSTRSRNGSAAAASSLAISLSRAAHESRAETLGVESGADIAIDRVAELALGRKRHERNGPAGQGRQTENRRHGERHRGRDAQADDL